MAMLGAFALVSFTHILVYIFGFRSNGIAKGTIASWMMGKAKGRVAARSLFAGLQSIGAAGIGPLGAVALTFLGGSLGFWYCDHV